MEATIGAFATDFDTPDGAPAASSFGAGAFGSSSPLTYAATRRWLAIATPALAAACSSASAMAIAVGKRSAGALESAFMHTSPTSFGSEGTSSCGGFFAPESSIATVCPSLSPRNRRRVVRSSHSTMPAANTSLRRSTPTPVTCSGER